MSNWDQRFMDLAHHISGWSKDRSTRVGCVLVDPHTRAVIAQGFNGFPRGVREHSESTFLMLDPDRWARPTKYFYAEHAERNAIYNAARHGHATDGCWAYLNFSPDDICADCARALIQAGIRRITGPDIRMQRKQDGDWYNGRKIAQLMFDEAQVDRFTLPRHSCE